MANEGIFMKRIVNIYRFVLKHPVYLGLGIVFMLFFALFSGVSITLVIPLFDYIFVTDGSVEAIYLNLPDFYEAVHNEIGTFKTDLAGYTEILNRVKIVLSQTDPWLLLKVICGLLVCLFLLKNTFYFFNRMMFINLRGNVIKEIRNSCYQNYLSQSYSFFNQNRVGDSIVRMINDIEIVNNFFIDAIYKLLREFTVVIIYAIIAASLNLKLFLISLLILPPFTIAVRYLSSKMKKYARRIQAQLSDMFSNIEEVLNSMKIVKAFCKESFEHERLKALNKKHFLFWRKSQVYTSFALPISEMSSVFIGIIIIFIGGAEILDVNSDFTFGNFTAFLFAIFSMMHPLKSITTDITEMKKAMVSVDRVSEILEMKSEIVESSHPISKKEFLDKIEFQNVCFSYQPDTPVLKDCNFVIEKGQKIAFVGSSGSGKTTCVNLINRMYDVSSGEVLFDGINVKKIKIHDLRKLFGVVTQDSVLFSDTIANNIRYGSNEDKSLAEIKTACHFAFADEFIENLPEGYETFIMPRGSNFSGGQKQRLCIARAIIQDPPILIFDEATSALDTEAEQKVQKAIDMATGNRTVIIIAHRLSTILSADKIVVLDKGEIVGVGKHEDLMVECAKYRHFYDLQFSNKS